MNIPDYNLQVIRSGKADLKMKVIVGKKATPTVTFYDEIEQIVVNPSWTVPTSIVRNELFNKIKDNPQYLSKHYYKIYSTGNNRKEISWEEIEWSKFTPSNFNYTIRQIPGPWNALGSIKFSFPNNHDIYLHDTSEKRLFSKRARAFSHGCVRVEKPFEMAEYLLKETTNISTSTLKVYLNNTKTEVLHLEYPVPVALSYFTCFTDENLALHFREDIYDLDVITSEELDPVIGRL